MECIDDSKHEINFSECKSLESVILNWCTPNLVTLKSTFAFSGIKEIDLSSLNPRQLLKMNHCFEGCVSLRKIKISGWDMQCIENLDSCFKDCESLKELDFSNWKIRDVWSMYECFSHCIALEKLDISSWGLIDTILTRAFKECYSLKEIYCTEDIFNRIKNQFPESDNWVWYDDVAVKVNN